LSVVRYMIDNLGFPPDRLAATGFGEYRPVEPGDSPAARAQNRRIELKLTER
jgi:chemotaxis protein MotB